MKLIFFFFFFLFEFSVAQSVQEDFSEICFNHNIVGGSLITYDNGKINKYHYGFSNVNKKKLVDDNTMYKVASISKIITAIAVMQLYEKGLIDLNDDINKYLNFAVVNYKYLNTPITIKMLLNHTSSLMDSDSYFEFLTQTHTNSKTPYMSTLFTRNNEHFLNKKPGYYFNYSNLNYGLLGMIIELVSQTRFDQYIKDNLLSPLNISGGFDLNEIDYHNLSVLYRSSIPTKDYFNIKPSINFSSYELGTNSILFSPHSGCRISAEDLLKILELFLNEGTYFDGENYIKILNKETIHLMLNPTWKYNGINGDNFFGLFNKWGLGLQITTNVECGDIVFNNQTMYGHIGQAYGLVADIYFNNEQGFVFIANGYYDKEYIMGDKSSFLKIEEEVFETLNYWFDYGGSNLKNNLHFRNNFEMYNLLGKPVNILEHPGVYIYNEYNHKLIIIK